jgi:hypothetical protein
MKRSAGDVLPYVSSQLETSVRDSAVHILHTRSFADTFEVAYLLGLEALHILCRWHHAVLI